MKALLEYLGRRVRTLTVYDYTGSDEKLAELAGVLGGYGARLQTVDTDGSGPENVAVLHQGGEVIGACRVDSLLVGTDVERAFGPQSPRPELLSELSTDVAVKPAQTVREMVRISREFERRALREGAGELHAGFQQLSQIAGSERTTEMYSALANEGVDVYVYGFPNTTLGNVPFTVVEDGAGKLEKHWFLLYDGDGNPARKATLVSEECPTEEGALVPTDGEQIDRPEGNYASYFTTDPESVDTLFELAEEEHGDLLRLSG